MEVTTKVSERERERGEKERVRFLSDPRVSSQMKIGNPILGDNFNARKLDESW